MKIKAYCFKIMITLLGLLSTFIFVLPGQAANRNDFLFDLKDTLNSPVGEKISVISAILIIATCVAVIMLFRFYFSKEDKAQQAARELYREKKRSQSASQQKRNWFRLTTSAEFRWIPADQADRVKESKYYVDELIDISGGGLSFRTEEILNAKDEIIVLLPTDDDKPLSLEGRIVRVDRGDEGFNISVQFIGLLDGQRDKVIAWIQKGQRNSMYIKKHENEDEEVSEEKVES